jgi:hypothetical protein
MSAVVSPGSVAEALGMLRSAMGYLAEVDATALGTATQAQCLRELEQGDAVGTAARASFLVAFTSGQGYADDGDYSARSWLIHQTRITPGAAVGHTAWAKRAVTHRLVMAALATARISQSYARAICLWTDRLPEESREAADEILLAAAARGMVLEDLAGLAEEMFERSRSGQPDADKDKAFDDRAVKLATTFGGAGVLHGDLTPECATIVSTVLDALSAPAGAEDDRTHEQRYHDALQEAMRRLAASNLLPERAGQPVRAWVHISLADLMRQQGSSALLDQWAAQVRAPWAARRARASEGTGTEGAWLDGAAADAITCDAAMAPVVTGDVNVDALEELVRLCVRLDRHRRSPATSGPDSDDDAMSGPATSGPAVPSPAREAIERAIIGAAVDLLSGPGGLASFLRRRQLGARLAGPSLPLDIGYSATIPAGIRHAVIVRDRHCRWPGGCDQPAAACEVHHTTHKANGGNTSTRDCVLLCSFHHQVMIHRRSWTLVLNPDGTTTAWNKDKTKVLHSHGPPARAG